QRAVARFALAERFLGFISVMDVNADADPFMYGVALGAQRDSATQMPAIFAVPAPVTMRRHMRRARFDRFLPRSRDYRQVVAVHRRRPAFAEALFDRQPR